MSLTRSALASQRVQWLTPSLHNQSELKHRFFSCFSAQRQSSSEPLVPYCPPPLVSERRGTQTLVKKKDTANSFPAQPKASSEPPVPYHARPRRSERREEQKSVKENDTADAFSAQQQVSSKPLFRYHSGAAQIQASSEPLFRYHAGAHGLTKKEREESVEKDDTVDSNSPKTSLASSPSRITSPYTHGSDEVLLTGSYSRFRRKALQTLNRRGDRGSPGNVTRHGCSPSRYRTGQPATRDSTHRTGLGARAATDPIIGFTDYGKHIQNEQSGLDRPGAYQQDGRLLNFCDADAISEDPDLIPDLGIVQDGGSARNMALEESAAVVEAMQIMPLAMQEWSNVPALKVETDTNRTLAKQKTLADHAVELYEIFKEVSDHPDFQAIERLPPPIPKNRDYLLEAGEAAYDWRPTLDILLSTSQPMSDAELQSLQRNLRNLRDLVNAHTPVLDRRAFDAHHPSEWTTKTFAQYVCDLAQMSRRTKPKVDRRDRHRSSIDPIRVRMLDTICNPASRTLLSYEAFHMAIMYLQKHGYVRDSLRLVAFMSEVGLEPTAETYNNLLFEIGQRKNLVVFTAILRKMVNTGVKPNANTWGHFVLCLDSPAVQNIIIEQMQKLDYFRFAPLLRSINAYTIGPALQDHLSNGGTFVAFCKRLDERWGKQWMNSTTLNIMLRRIGNHGQFLDVIQCVTIMLTHWYTTPDPMTLIKLLEICRGFGRPKAAIAFVRFFEKTLNIMPDEYAMHKLLSIFYVHGHANCCRVVWQVACVRGLATYRMRRNVVHALRQPPHTVSEPFKDRFTRFRAYGSKVIAGRFMSFDWVRFWDEWLKHGDATIRERLLLTAANVLIHGDQQAYMQLFFTGSFADELMRAFDKDLEWQNRPEVLAGDVTWMSQNATNVSLSQALPKAESEQPVLPERAPGLGR